jgi:hypothetical protein
MPNQLNIAQKLVRVQQNGTIIKHHKNPLTKDDTDCCQKDCTNILLALDETTQSMKKTYSD